MHILGFILAAAMATATPHAHSTMRSNTMHSGAMHGKMTSKNTMHAMHTKMHGHMMASPTPRP